ncbi:MAG TPA: DedA family protein [Syntrophales bacterium]|nr:DedA family protein [Syntrophobacterales bacterium]HQL90148.1 DedA family protein [Syntrophales bacterium]
MDFIVNYIDFVLHIDRHLDGLIQTYGTWVYLILFAIIFCETGLVVTPFLPGDSLLFVTGTIAARGSLDLQTALMLLAAAAIIGDNVNYWVGRFVGAQIVERGWVKEEYLDRTHHFYEKYGGKTIFIGKFLPIIRTFAPFVAGIGKMTYPKFLAFNISGAITWMCVFILGGYFFGNLPFVKQNFTLVILGIIVLSILPSVFEFIRARRQIRQARQAVDYKKESGC